MINMGMFKKVSRAVVGAGLVLSLSASFAAEGDSGDDNGVPANYVIDAEYMMNLIRTVPSGDFAAVERNINTVLEHTERRAYKQIIDTLFERLTDEIAKGNFEPTLKPGDKMNGMDIKLVDYLIDVIGQIAPGAEYAIQLEGAIKNVMLIVAKDEATQLAFDHKKYPDRFAVYLKNCQNNTAPLVALPGSEPRDQKALDDELKDFRAFLETEIKGQPEVIDALVAIRQKDLVYGHRTHSPSVWLLGLPGVGKDTSARGYVNAINNDPEAWKSHMYTISPLVGKEDLWSILGSGTGYVGSENFPPFLEFLVNHSGGRYMKVKAEGGPNEKPKYKVIENPNWKPNAQFDFVPERAVLYLDEFHKWSKDIKDLFIKKALESDGTFRIYNPNEGLDKISVPVTIVIGSNDGISLLASREKNGQRFGAPLTYEQMLEKHQRVARDENAISGAILGGGGATSGSEISKGTSEELLNRVKTVIVMRPLSPAQLKEIADHKLRLMIASLAKSSGGYENVTIEYTPEVVNFIQEYHYVAEDNARPIEKRIETLFQEPLFEAFRNGAVKRGEKVTVRFGVRQEADKTYTGVIDFPGAKPARPQTTVPIRATEQEKARRPISDEELMVLDLLPEQLKKDVVGQDPAMDKIGRALKLSEEGRGTSGTNAEVKTAARTFLLLGYSSVGKTQTGKAVAKHLLKDESAVVTISFSPNMTEKELNEAILGTKDYKGEAIPSKFMQYYDRAAGRLVVLLDEVANVRDKDLLNKLYDLFREPVVTTFSDGRERVMSNVIFLVTGNAGQELHKELPAHLPEVVRREAMQEVHRRLAGNPNLQRQIYEQYFSAPLLARIGDDNIFNYGPLDYVAAAKLVQIKLRGSVNNLKPREGRRGWNLVFKDSAAYTKIVDAIEREGFNTREQGASIDHFVQQKFEEGLREMLLAKLVADGTQVVLDFGGIEKASTDIDHGADAEVSNRNKVVINVTVNGQTHQLKLEGIQQTPNIPKMKSDMILTSYHEAGHSIVRAALLGEYSKPGGFKVIPGVAHIAGQWVYYAGVASSTPILRVDTTREYLVREIAVLFGGAMAEDLIVEGGYSSHGKQNDMQRATDLAQRAILDFGLIPEWGLRNVKMEELSEADKNKLNQLVEDLLAEGKLMATEALRANYRLLEKLGNEGAQVGEVTGKREEQLYSEMKLLTETSPGYDEAIAASKLGQPAATGARRGMGVKFVSTLSFIKETDIVDLAATLEAKRDAQMAKLTIPEGTPMLSSAPAAKAATEKTPAKPSRTRAPKDPNPTVTGCEGLLKGA